MAPDTTGLLAAWREAPGEVDQRAAVRAVLAELARVAPGRSVELRIPPYGAVQIVAGPVHRRGTPKAVVEMPADTLLDLAAGSRGWDDAVGSGAVLASGERADLGRLFPL